LRGSALVLFAVTADYLFSKYRLQAPIFKIPASYALGSSVKLADRREFSFCNYRLLQGFILYRNLFDFAYYVPHLKKWRGHVPRVPHQIGPMLAWSVPTQQQSYYAHSYIALN